MDTESQELHNKGPIGHSTCYLTSLCVQPAQGDLPSEEDLPPTHRLTQTVQGTQELSGREAQRPSGLGRAGVSS